MASSQPSVSTASGSASRFSGKVALVSGAGRGIGAATALAFARAGADVALNDLPTSSDLNEVVEACRACGVRAIGLPADLAQREQVEGMVDGVVEQLGGLDLVVSNAAYSDRELFYEADLGGFERTIQVTMWGAFYLVRAASRSFLARGCPGSIVVVSSNHASEPIPGSMAYNMAKAALEQMVKTAATELIGRGIRVNAVRPGWVDTPGERKFFTEDSIRSVGKTLPLGRLQRPEEIAGGILFLSDPASESVTGSVLTIDGGIQLPIDQLYRLEQQPK